MAVLPLRIEGDPLLFAPCKSVDIDENVLRLCKDMHDTLNHTRNGIALSATQVGVPLRLFVMGGRHQRPQMEQITFINPNILKLWGGFKSDNETNLSVPGVMGRVLRHQKVKIEYTDTDGVIVTRTFKGFTARVVQHLMDHIEGKPFYVDFDPADAARAALAIRRLRSGEIPKLNYLINFKGKLIQPQK